ncbi:hypothetical protein [Actinoplanes sp. NPDC026670]|uniref:hypothetical protein n=1 Tax=Actinoplanes sp. NPDC026670 TaxID=3154700 RepID=UPI0033E69AF6
MTLDQNALDRLNERAGRIGTDIGWELEVSKSPAGNHFGVQASDSEDGNFVLGPVSEDTAEREIESLLDRLEAGTTVILRDDEGTVRAVDR